MNLKVKAKKLLALQSLRLISSGSPLKNFSWNRVRYNLAHLNSAQNVTYDGDNLVLIFTNHKHYLYLNKNGHGLLFNPFSKGSIGYYLLMPKDIQESVILIWEANKAPIPINLNLN